MLGIETAGSAKKPLDLSCTHLLKTTDDRIIANSGVFICYCVALSHFFSFMRIERK
jgi:hypothetical protein